MTAPPTPAAGHYDATRDAFREIALHADGYYDTRPGRRPAHSIWQRRVRRLALSLLDRYLRTNPRAAVVDAGCGRADFAIELTVRHPRLRAVCGTDFVPETLAIARAAAPARSPLAFQAADLRSLPYRDHAFDVAVCVNVLHHIHADHLADALAELARVTRDCMILEIKNRRNWYYRGIRVRYAPPGTPIHVFPTSRADVTAALRARGFRLTGTAALFVVEALSPLLVLRYERGPARTVR
jgi:SAM-dependent methyltransferase